MLKKSEIDKATYEGDGKSRHIIWDDQVTGLGLRIYPSGRKAFILSYRNADRQKRLLTLGRYGVLTVKQARDMALRELGEVTRGKDPTELRRARNRAATVKELCEAYTRDYARPHKKTWEKDDSRLKRHVIPRWGARKAGSIRHTDVARLHRQLGVKTPYEANRTLEIIRVMFKFAQDEGYVPEGFENPATRVKKHREKKRDRWVTEAELPALAQAIDEEPNIYIRAVLWLYLFTGARKTELLAARWEQVDLGERVLRLPETKAGRSHVIPLPEPALKLLQGLPREEGNDHVFPGRNEGCPLVNIDKAWNRVRARAGVPDVRLHDLRRTVGSWLVNSGHSLVIVQKTLNHSTHTAALTYARLSQDPVRAALDEHAKRLLVTAGKDQEAEVIPFGRVSDV